MSLFSKLFSKPVNFEGFADWHCHILPGVDDGVSTPEDALKFLGEFEQLGFQEVWFTPHIMADVPNTTQALRKRFAELQQLYQGSMQLHLAAENMLDNLFVERLEANDLLPIGPEQNTLLVETSYFNAPYGLDSTLQKIMSAGYFPLLAHPERYNYIDSIKEYKRLHDMGVKFQLNIISLGGYYGPVVKEKAQKLLQLGLIDRVGTDLHHPGHLEALKRLRISASIASKLPHFDKK